MRKLLLITLFFVGSTSIYGQKLTITHNSTPSAVVLPDLPNTLTFAGEKVPLENFDTRESLMREVLTTMYLHSKTIQCLMLTTRYFPIIEPIMKEYGIPEDLKYLCVAESGLNPNAQSGAKAAGLWQMMPTTGAEYGLEIGSEVDERYDIEKSTRAACQHLKKDYEKFGSWALTAAAYNLGRTGVERRKAIQCVDNYYDMFLPQETLRYMFRILAFKLIIENPTHYGYVITKEEYCKPLKDYRDVSVSDLEIDWSQVAIQNGTTYKMLRELNHWIRDYKHKNPDAKEYIVKIPNKNFRK